MNKKYKLSWSEEFNGPEIDRSLWDYEIGYIRNNEPQYYTDSPENSYIKDSCLVIETKETGNSEMPYTSASLNTLGHFEFMYGRIEMRAKLPRGTGIWPAFWTLGSNFKEVGWPACGELDILELVGGGINDARATSNFHYPNKPHDHMETAFLLDGDFSENFHIFGMEWDEKTVKTYVDGIVYNSLDISEMDWFHKPHFILVNTAIARWIEGYETNEYPQKYYIDWIRYYKPED